jgi:hypothetical protein
MCKFLLYYLLQETTIPKVYQHQLKKSTIVYQACTNHVPTSPYHTPHVYANSSTKCLIHEPNIYFNHIPKHSSRQPT